MLDITNEENILILEILELPFSYLTFLLSQESSVYQSLGDAFVTRVRELLEEYKTLDEIEANNGLDANNGKIKKLDVIEYFGTNESNPTSQLDKRVGRVKKRLITLLNMQDFLGGSGYSANTKLVRG